jgi:molybdenum cofactor cytidylyltransferase
MALPILEPSVSCIILAAGSSHRFGSAKMLHVMPDGRPMILHSIQPYLMHFDKIHVVVAEGDTSLKECLAASAVTAPQRENQQSIGLRRADISVVNCTMYPEGMSQSLISGIQSASNAKAWLIGLGDMPYINAATIGELISNLDGDNIVMPRHQQRLGNPVCFGHRFKADLLSLRGDIGAKSVTRDYSDAVRIIDVEDEGILIDVDYPP